MPDDKHKKNLKQSSARKGKIMKTYTNTITNIGKTGVQLRRKDGTVDSVVKITTADGQSSENTRRTAKGGYRAGSHYHGDEKCLRTADMLCKGADLMSALKSNYAKCGITREGIAWASEFYYKFERGILYRKTKSAKHETAGWKPAYNCTGRIPQEILQDFNGEETRTQSPSGYQTSGTDNNRNRSVLEARRHGLLKA